MFHRSQPADIGSNALKELLDIDPCPTLEELSAALDVHRSTVEKCPHALGMIQNAGSWLPYELKERDIEIRLVTCEMLLQRQKRKGFLHAIINGDEKLIHYDNPKRKLGLVKLGEPGPSTPKRNIHGLNDLYLV
ncbi:hypothetical protein Trydic_g15153 [Trypoxylus dichotomus]